MLTWIPCASLIGAAGAYVCISPPLLDGVGLGCNPNAFDAIGPGGAVYRPTVRGYHRGHVADNIPGIAIIEGPEFCDVSTTRVIVNVHGCFVRRVIDATSERVKSKALAICASALVEAGADLVAIGA